MVINSRRKGARVERELVALLQDSGFAAEKTSRSGYTGHDLTVPFLGKDRTVECKVRGGDGFSQLYRWLGPVEFLIVKADRKEPLIIIRLKQACELGRIMETAHHEDSNRETRAVSYDGG